MYCRTANYGYPSVWSFGGASVVENQQVGSACLDAVDHNFIYFCSCLFLSLILRITSVGTVMTVLHTCMPVVCRVVPELCVTLLCCYPVCQTVMGYSPPPVSLNAGLLSFLLSTFTLGASVPPGYIVLAPTVLYYCDLMYSGWWILSNMMKWTIKRQLGCLAVAC